MLPQSFEKDDSLDGIPLNAIPPRTAETKDNSSSSDLIPRGKEAAVSFREEATITFVDAKSDSLDKILNQDINQGEIKLDLENKNKYHALSALPESAEKCLRFLLAYYQYEQDKTDPNTFFFSPDSLEFVHERLLQHIEKEQKNSDSIGRLKHLTNEIKRTMDTYANSQKLEKSGKMKPNRRGCVNVIQAINALQEIICPLDMDLMLALLDDNASVADTIANKEVTVLLGNTGSGKTTFVHWLAGSTLELSSTGHYEVHAETEVLKSFTTSSGTQSETSCINAVEIACPASTDNRIIVCDTPGYHDTRSIEVDIANGIGVASALRNCRKVKVIVLISKLSFGDRGEGLLLLVKELEKLLPPVVDEQTLSAFMYVYTKFSSGERDAIMDKIDAYHRNAEKNQHHKIATILSDMLTKLEVDRTDTLCFIDNPLDTSKQSPLFNKIIGTPPIDSPQDVFCDFVSSKSLDTLKKEIEVLLLSFKQAFITADVALAQRQFNRLARLNQLVQMDEVKRAYDELNASVEETLKSLFATLSHLFKSIKDISNLADPKVEQIKVEFNRQVQYLFNLKDLQGPLELDHDRNTCFLFQEYLATKISEIHEACQLNSESEFVWTRIAQGFELLDKLQKLFEPATFRDGYDVSAYFSEAYKKAQNVWSDRFQQHFNDALSAFRGNDLTRVIAHADEMRAMHDNFGVHLSDKTKTLYTELCQEINNYFTCAKQQVDQDLQKEIDWSTALVNPFFEPLSKLKSSVNESIPHLEQHIQRSAIQGDYKNLIVRVHGYFSQIIEKLKTDPISELLFMQCDHVLLSLEKLIPLSDEFFTSPIQK